MVLIVDEVTNELICQVWLHVYTVIGCFIFCADI